MSFRLRINDWSGLYAFGYVLVSSGIQSYYRRFEVNGLENVPLDKPILFAPNHQNAFMDGAVIGYAVMKPTYYLGRADVFQKPVGNFFLSGFNCLPVYRPRDGDDYREKNIGAFETFYKVLGKNRPINIFPEGSHYKDKNIRGPLKKGVFRIALGAEEHSERELDVHIIPVGIEYERHNRIGGTLLVNFGEPYRILEHVKESETQQEEEFSKLIVDLEKRIDRLMINIPTEHYDSIYPLLDLFKVEIHAEEKTLHAQFQNQKSFVKRMVSKLKENPQLTNDLKVNIDSLHELCAEKDVKPQGFSDRNVSQVLRLLFLVIGAPIALFALLTSYIPFMIPQWLVNAKVKDVHFQTSIKAILGPLCFIVFWTIEALVVNLFMSFEYLLLFIALLPISAWMGWKWWKNLKKFFGRMRFIKWQNQNEDSFKTAVKNWKVLSKVVTEN